MRLILRSQSNAEPARGEECWVSPLHRLNAINEADVNQRGLRDSYWASCRIECFIAISFEDTPVMSPQFYSLMQSAVPLWMFIAVAAMAVSAIVAAGWFALSNRRKRESSIARPTTGDVLGVRWRWHYRDGDIRDITPFCPRCDSQVSAMEETRHGYLHLISFRCTCRRWQSQSFQCSHDQLVKQVYSTLKNRAGNAAESIAQS